MITEGTVKRLRVFALSNGTLLLHYREGARQPIDDAWWQDVLLDPARVHAGERDLFRRKQRGNPNPKLKNEI